MNSVNLILITSHNKSSFFPFWEGTNDSESFHFPTRLGYNNIYFQ